jgi:NDP-sugar pyrophosphorylase family protein
MKAMILAAGLGKRLRPLTNDRPKALVEVGGRTLLEITIMRLRDAGVTEIIVNVHHFGAMIASYLKDKNNFGIRIEISSEETLLDTGGGLKQAAWFFLESDSGDEPFFLHNVDVLSTVDLRGMAEFHRRRKSVVTLAVQDRETSRYLLFNSKNELCGRRIGSETPEIVRPQAPLTALAFSGIHVLSPSIAGRLTETGTFSIITSYLRMAAEGEKITAFRADQYYWRDLGRPTDLAQADDDLKRGIIPQ